MTKSQLVDVIAKKAHLTKKASTEAIEALFEEVTRSLAKGDKVVISGFGTFSVIKRAARQGINPKTMEKIQIAARKAPKFKAGKALKDAVK